MKTGNTETAMTVVRDLGALTLPDDSKAKTYARASRADATLRSYEHSFRLFTMWCATQGCDPAPDTPIIAAFIAHLADGGMRPSTISKTLAGLAFIFRARGVPFDRKAVDAVMSGIARTHGTAPRQVDALTIGLLRRVVAAMGADIRDARDRALLLLGFAGAFRRSELVGLTLGEGGQASVAFVPEGLRITLHRSKTDQEGQGLVKAIPRGGVPCPVAALEAWLAAAQITEGPVFRPITRTGVVRPQRLTDRSVADVIKIRVKQSARASGMSEVQAEAEAARVSGHSLRAGFATSAAGADITGEVMARHVGWKDSKMAARYVREAELFAKNPLKRVMG